MSIARAIETTATIDTPHNLHLDEPLPQVEGRVCVIVLLRDEEYDDSDIDEAAWLRGASLLQAPDFAEDVYTWKDGKPCDEA